MSDESTHENLEQDPELAASEGTGEELDDERLEAVAGGWYGYRFSSFRRVLDAEDCCS